jgi:glycosyltransferase involved in cell wall biosynthesis
MASGIWSVTERTARHLRPFRNDIYILPNPAAVIGAINGDRPPGCSDQVRIVLIGSLEPRKGQDIAVEAIKRMSEEYRRRTTLTMFGRRHDPDFVANLIQSINGPSGIELGPELSPSDCLEEIRRSDIVLLASRDDTLPLVSLDCLALGRVLVCTRETGTSDFLEDGVSGFIAENASPQAVADALTRALAQRSQWAEIGKRGREICTRNFTYEIFQKRLLAYIGCPNTSLCDAR